MINKIILKYFPINEKKINKALLLLIYLFPISLLSPSAINNTFVTLVDIFFIIILFKEKNYTFIKNKTFVILIIYWFYLIINLFFSIDFSNSLSRSLGIIRFIFFAYAIEYCLKLKSSKYQKNIFNIWTIIFLIVSFDLLFESAFGFNTLGFVSYMPGRLASFLNTELKIGNFYHGFLFIIVAFFFIKNKNKLSLFFLITFTIISLLIGERSNFAKVIISLFIFLFFFEKKFFNLKKIIILFLIIIICSIVLLKSPSRSNRFNGQFFSYILEHGITKYLYVSQNFAHNITAYKIFLNYPMLGVGLRNFNQECNKDIYNDEKLNYNQGRCSTHPHQYYFEILSETGIIGLILFISTFFYILYYGFKTYLKKKNLIQLASLTFVTSSLIPFLPSGSFYTTYSASIFWLNIGIIFAFSSYSSNKRK